MHLFGFFKKEDSQRGMNTNTQTPRIIPSQSSREKTEMWYNEEWPTIQTWVTELAAAKNVDSIYIENFLDTIPQEVDKKYLCEIFNDDGGYWRMTMDTEKSLVIVRK